MPPRAPVVWATSAVGSERFRQRLDERHRELTVQAKVRGRSYRRSRSALGRLSSFETAITQLARCRYEAQLTVTADDLTRDYFELWQLVARRGTDQRDLEERAADRLDYFATQLGRLEGIADALVVAGRNVRLFPLPTVPWVTVS